MEQLNVCSSRITSGWQSLWLPWRPAWCCGNSEGCDTVETQMTCVAFADTNTAAVLRSQSWRTRLSFTLGCGTVYGTHKQSMKREKNKRSNTRFLCLYLKTDTIYLKESFTSLQDLVQVIQTNKTTSKKRKKCNQEGQPVFSELCRFCRSWSGTVSNNGWSRASSPWWPAYPDFGNTTCGGLHYQEVSLYKTKKATGFQHHIDPKRNSKWQLPCWGSWRWRWEAGPGCPPRPKPPTVSPIRQLWQL